MAVSLHQIFGRGGSSNGLNGGTIGILCFQRKTGVSPLHVTIAGCLASLALIQHCKNGLFLVGLASAAPTMAEFIQ